MGLRTAAAWMLGLSVSSAVSAQHVPETDAEREHFLRTARIVASRALAAGTTSSKRLTLSDGTLTHDAHAQSVEIGGQAIESLVHMEAGFTDSYRYNIAAYALDRLLGLRMVPVTVLRDVNGEKAAVTWWVDGRLMTERERLAKKLAPPPRAEWAKQNAAMNLFDQLIANTDRNVSNVVIDSAWKLWMVDHTRAFRTWKKPKKPESLGWIDRAVYERLKRLTAEEVNSALGSWIGKERIDALLARRKAIVEEVERRLRTKGEREVFYEWLR